MGYRGLAIFDAGIYNKKIVLFLLNKIFGIINEIVRRIVLKMLQLNCRR
jgi:hypothetical protein